MITLNIIDKTLARGPGIWRMNERLLRNADFCDKMKAEIKSAKEDISKTKMDDIDIWEYVKKRCHTFAQQYTKNVSQIKKNLYNNLLSLRYELQHVGVNNLNANCKRQHIDTYDMVNDKIKELENERLQSSIYRTRQKWANQGEKMTKMFFSLEKRNYVNKTMFTLIKESGEICTNHREILEEQLRFYKELYTSDPEVKFTLRNVGDHRLTADQNKMLDQDIQWSEIVKSIWEMKTDKVPGCDGLGLGFYRHFLTEIKDLLWNMYQNVLKCGKFGLSSRKGIISLLPKKKDPRYIKNLRPLSLLNYDFKILAKVLATRMKLVLPDIISEEQCGFTPNREIHDSLRNTIDIITHVYQSGKKAVIISIDFLKCFDRIEHESIFETLKYFNFGAKFIEWSKIFFNDILFCTQNAGFTSDFTKKERGINQGCTYSPFCFTVCGELMCQLIKSNPNIKGIKIANSAAERVISQFADDTGLFLTYSETCINEALKVLAIIEGNTGLRISYEKTCIYRIGSLRNTDAQCYTIKPIKWSDADIDMLGIKIKNAEHQDTHEFHEVINKVEAVTKTWYNRTLTIMGKVLVINALLSSLFVYKMFVLPMLTVEQVNRFNALVTNFLWQGKKAKIPTAVLQQNKQKGGLKLVNIVEKQRSFYMKWVVKAIKKGQYRYVYQWLDPNICETIWYCNLNANDCKKLFGIGFWVDVLVEWCKLNFHDPQNATDVEKQCLFYNSNIKVDENCVKPKMKWYEAGIRRIEDLLKENGTFLSHKEVEEKFQICISWLHYSQIMTAIPTRWKNLLYTQEPETVLTTKIDIDVLTETKKPTVYVYNMIIDNKIVNNVNKYKNKLANILEIEISVTEYYGYFKALYKLTNIVKLRNFQYRLLLGKIYTNDILSKWKIVDSEKCEYCNEKQTIIHLMIHCKNTKILWELIRKCLPSVEISPENIMLNNVLSQKHIANLFILVTKYYIFQQKCLGQRSNINGLKSELRFTYNLEHENAQIKHKLKDCEKRWRPVLPELFLA